LNLGFRQFFNSIDPKQKSDLRPLCANSGHSQH
jgi:hypothetical protein